MDVAQDLLPATFLLVEAYVMYIRSGLFQVEFSAVCPGGTVSLALTSGLCLGHACWVK